MDYTQAQHYLASFINYERMQEYPYGETFKLQRMRDLLRALKDPHENLRCIHIAGSKGKGSTSAFCAYMLRAAGFTTGLYTSPHLHTFRERIRILKPCSSDRQPADVFEGMISEDDVTRLVAIIKPVADAFAQTSTRGKVSFFEIYTALAFLYFKQQGVDCVVLETGLGGRLDATNVATALVSLITPISYEHTHILGSTLTVIAQEKCGIIKGAHPVVISAAQEPEAAAAITQDCRNKSATLFQEGKDFLYDGVAARGTGQTFDHRSSRHQLSGLLINLLGRHQVSNAACALAAMEALEDCGITVTEDAMRQGLCDARWPARLEIIRSQPYVILDGCQNKASARAAVTALKDNFSFHRAFVVVGISQDKDLHGIISEIEPLADEVVVTAADNPRAAPPETIAALLTKPHRQASTIKEALAYVLSVAKKNDLIVVLGSLFVAGEARTVLTNNVYV